MTSDTLAILDALAENCDDVRSPRYEFYRELRSVIESQAKEIDDLKTQLMAKSKE